MDLDKLAALIRAERESINTAWAVEAEEHDDAMAGAEAYGAHYSLNCLTDAICDAIGFEMDNVDDFRKASGYVEDETEMALRLLGL